MKLAYFLATLSSNSNRFSYPGVMDLDEDAFDYAFESVPKLVGRSNFTTWKNKLLLALAMSRALSYTNSSASSVSPRFIDDITWRRNDKRIAARILTTCQTSIGQEHFHIFKESGPGRARAVFQALDRSYGFMAGRSILSLGMEFMYSKCEDNGDVDAWMDKLDAQQQALKDANFTVEDMAVIVILRGLPSRFSHYVDHVLMTNDKVPKLDEVRRAIRAINAAHQVEMKREEEDPALRAINAAHQVEMKKEEDLALAARARQLVISQQHASMDTPPKSRSSRRRKNKKRREEERKQEVQVEYALTAICL